MMTIEAKCTDCGVAFELITDSYNTEQICQDCDDYRLSQIEE
jgi:DNA-directed RNA polymerase subunit RPC12/RpoP